MRFDALSGVMRPSISFRIAGELLSFLDRHSRRHTRGTPRGQPRRYRSCEHEQHRSASENSWVPRTDLKQERRQPASEHHGTDDTGDQTTPEDAGGVPQYQRPHVSGSRTERQADSNLGGGLANRIGQYSLEANGGKR